MHKIVALNGHLNMPINGTSTNNIMQTRTMFVIYSQVWTSSCRGVTHVSACHFICHRYIDQTTDEITMIHLYSTRALVVFSKATDAAEWFRGIVQRDLHIAHCRQGLQRIHPHRLELS
jgi:hypothetical protein